MKKNPKPFNTSFLPEKDGHKVAYFQYGNSKGEAILLLHGGPGSKHRAKNAKGYDPKKYHVIAFDQRGCGKSLPAGELESNTLSDLIKDIERLRKELKVKKWFVAGGSWGSTLALAYAQAHPEQVKGLLLSSIFLASSRDEKWAFSEANGIDRMFTDLWEDRLAFLEKYKTTPVNAAKDLLDKIGSGSKEVVNDVVAGVSNWEGNLMNAQENLTFIDPEDVQESDINAVKVFLHFEANDFFLTDDQLIKNMSKIKSIPAVIVHGRYDLLCPVEASWNVQKGFDTAEVIILPTSNHKLTADGAVAKELAYNLFLEKLIINFPNDLH